MKIATQARRHGEELWNHNTDKRESKKYMKHCVSFLPHSSRLPLFFLFFSINVYLCSSVVSLSVTLCLCGNSGFPN